MSITGLNSDGNIDVDISTHDDGTSGLKLGGTLVTSSATELNLLDGKAAANLALTGKVEGTDFTDSLLVGHSTTGTLSSALRNTGVGIDAMDAITSGDNNTCVGFQAGTALTTGSWNVALGTYTGNKIEDGNFNTLLGYSAGSEVSSGLRNICIGKGAGDNITTGDGNVIIGAELDAASATGDGQMIIGTYAGGAITWIQGNSDGNVEIATNWNPSLSTTGKALVMGF